MSDDTTPPPPPPPPPNPYGAPPTPAGGFNATDAIKYGWAKFTKSPSTLIVPALIVLACVIVVEVVAQLVLRSTLLSTDDCGIRSTADGGLRLDDCGPGFVTSLFASSLASFVVQIVIMALGAGLIRCALNVVDGRAVESGDIFAYATKSNVLVTAALVSIATFIGTLLCVLPGIVVAFLTFFSMYFVVDKDMSPVDAIKASISFTSSHVGELILLAILCLLCIAAGAIACLVGLLAALPVVWIAGAYAYRVLQGETVTPVEG